MSKGDPIVALWAEKMAIEERLKAIPDLISAGEDAVILRHLDRLLDLKGQIAALSPASPAGAAALARLLREKGHSRNFEWGEVADQIVDNLIAGLEAMVAGSDG